LEVLPFYSLVFIYVEVEAVVCIVEEQKIEEVKREEPAKRGNRKVR
jgi:hypothetical protein